MTIRYQLIADELRGEIVSGRLAAGDQLPGEAALALEHGVSKPTMRHALDVLQAEGRIERSHGRGTFVRRPPEAVTYAAIQGRLSPPALSSPLNTHVSARTVQASTTVASLMEMPVDTALTEYAYVNLQEDTPHSLAYVYVPQDLARRLVPAPAGTTPWGEEILDGLAATELGTPVHISHRVTARPPTAREADRLRLPRGLYVLAVERRTTGAERRVVEGSYIVLPADRADAFFTVPSAYARDGEER